MKKKGLVYRLTMLAGVGFIGMQAGSELLYWKVYKKQRDQEIDSEKRTMTKLSHM